VGLGGDVGYEVDDGPISRERLARVAMEALVELAICMASVATAATLRVLVEISRTVAED